MARVIQGKGWRLIDRSEDVLRSAENQVERAIAKATVKVQWETKRLLKLNSSRGASKDPSIPRSKPVGGVIPGTGEPPYRETGTLAQSIDSETVESRGVFLGRVGTNKKYGFWLELGTRYMVARPFLRPALMSQVAAINALIKRAGKGIR